MSVAELERFEVLTLRRDRAITQADAAFRLGLTERQVRRLEVRLKRDGVQGLRSVKRGLPSNRRLDPVLAQEVCSLISAHYADFGPTLACEYLEERHGIILAVETVRQLMVAAELWHPRRGPQARLHPSRRRRERFGEMLQIDGSKHDWFEDRGPRCSLLVFIDDATSTITDLRFVESETTFGYMRVLRDHIVRYGLPATLYSDKHSIFRVNSGQHLDAAQTQFKAALDRLGIELICAHSPQAKGRVERANGVLQDRLVKALRLADISSMAAANAWLGPFLEAHNRRFATRPALADDAHVAYGGKVAELTRILAKQQIRTLSANLTCQFETETFQVHIPSGGTGMRGAKVTVIQQVDGTTQLLWRGRSLKFTIVERASIIKAPRTLMRKEVDELKLATKPRKTNRTFNNVVISPSTRDFGPVFGT